MSNSAIKHELQDFVQFANRRIETGEADSIEELVHQWRHDAEYLATVADIRQGINDYDEGQAEPIDNAFQEIRLKLGITD